ncbi:hypothetical protein [Mameliella sediminis]|uniref:hypothetical protein n=1 Tax=Mameliella sediminis TaxID=2836866 RepID=UPI001C487BE4|nr:hypothetical protein [Mameliella sediminis]MBV7394554.1 hypothetical protein [Mameliella sediminis]
MLGEVPLGAGECATVLKLSARAIVRLERKHKKGIDKILDGMTTEEGGTSFAGLVGVFAELMDGGRGADEEAAFDLLDQVGLVPGMAAFEEACEAAFPDAAPPAPGKPIPQGKK